MELSLKNIKKSFSWVLTRFHVIIFSIIVLGGLVLAVFMLNKILVASTSTADTTDTTSGQANPTATFDQDTINRLKKLKSRDEPPTPLDFSGGRTNPFNE